MKNSTTKQTLDLAQMEEVGGGIFGWINWGAIVDTDEIENDLSTLAQAGTLAISIFGSSTKSRKKRRGRRRR